MSNNGIKNIKKQFQKYQNTIYLVASLMKMKWIKILSTIKLQHIQGKVVLLWLLLESKAYGKLKEFILELNIEKMYKLGKRILRTMLSELTRELLLHCQNGFWIGKKLIRTLIFRKQIIFSIKKLHPSPPFQKNQNKFMEVKKFFQRKKKRWNLLNNPKRKCWRANQKRKRILQQEILSTLILWDFSIVGMLLWIQILNKHHRKKKRALWREI